MSQPSQLETSTLDVHDEGLFVPWYAAYAAALDHAVGEAAQAFTYDELRAQWQNPTSDIRRIGFVGSVDGEVVAVGAAGLPQLENLTSAFVEVAVAPAHQGRGHGRALLDHVEEAVAAEGRTRLVTEVRWRYEQGTSGHDGGGSRDVTFAESAGFDLGLSDVQRWLDLPVDEALLDPLAAEAATHHDGYALRSWVGAVPDELAPTWAELDGSLMTEAPMGELEHEAVKADVARLREQEESIARQDRTAYHSVALDASGTVVAYSMLVQSSASTTAFQWGTLVHRDHRGHRLGLAVKVANHRLLQRERPDAVRVATWNAEVNSHMIGVNERLGFRPVSRMGEFQKTL
ncbi:GNAT family N-acetyltransferase [Nocardioides sp.]|uniref:GNAT family N-acetyltransferase n=1 Tax=Nocardioides sp. TaxID=35761 RepID=UPI00271AF476|nr:GNAT family N-acetyltransferase [Nocardioides sp.]MDO9454758.1 GNAT family N-acetyltransferase [Nocardioides sp.]